MQAENQQLTIKMDVMESYYIDSKFNFYVVSPAIVDEDDYVTSVIKINLLPNII